MLKNAKGLCSLDVRLLKISHVVFVCIKACDGGLEFLSASMVGIYICFGEVVCTDVVSLKFCLLDVSYRFILFIYLYTVHLFDPFVV
jgi:hypothetical protein